MIQAKEKRERWQARSIAIDSEWRLLNCIYNGTANFEHLSKTGA
jgi:hypothetical protein